ncbi:NAD(P)-binding protein [Bimuria novae-zelandiae CBS 107.79]|uniref:NAD(P)-binding protein n=1 Tax=Bimuria novae-zelandiae CBS 107.79 TaxID=1447943 RepID=A0A6A5ULP9_9PLEO|nr:NAD(P)-binding protein [Bimuria novae-zelandiae CBS 107.79]
MTTPPAHYGYGFVGYQNLHNDIYPAITASITPALQQPGKVVLVTGAGRGIGRSIALQYAHASVAAIVLCARTSSELDEVAVSIQKINSTIRVHKRPIDVTKDDAVKTLAQDVQRDEGRLDILVNNAGASAPWVHLTASDSSSWWNTFEVNLKGSYLFLQAFLSLLVLTAEKGNTTVDVVNVSSMGAHVVSPGASAYQISKLAVLRLSEFVNVEYGAKGVNTVSLHPGGVPTALGTQEESIRPYLIDTAELCGGFVVWLTAEPRTWLAGRYVSATWDVDVLESMRDGIVKEDKLKMFMSV